VRRATLVVVTRKAASDAIVESVHERIARVAPAVPRVSVRLDFVELVRADDSRQRKPLDTLRGSVARAILSIGDPGAFIRQLEMLGANVTASIFPDHHAFSDVEIDRIASGLTPGDLVVCTLKDAVKVGPRWPRLAPPLWYVSQQVIVERGVGGLERVLDDLVRSRSRTSPTAG
jgi:tetraacyldisaccharide 4'-kinase